MSKPKLIEFLENADNIVKGTSELTTLANKIAEDANSAITNKVDKVEGKGLSTNDFTNELKDKLDTLSADSTVDGSVANQLSNIEFSDLKNIPVLTIGNYVFDGTRDLTIPVYDGTVQ